MKLNLKRTFFVGLAFLSICAFWQLYDYVIPLILKERFHMNEALAGGVMALDNVLALFLLPLFGVLSDRTKTPIGRRMPFILGGTAGAVVAMALIPLTASFGSFGLFFAALGLALLSMSSYRSPAVALMPDVTEKPLRSKANAIINLMGSVGGILILAVISLAAPKGDNPNYLPLFLITAGVMVLSVAVLFFTTPENKLRLPEAPETAGDKASGGRLSRPELLSLCLILLSVFLWFMGYNAVTTAFSKYAKYYWGMEGGAPANTLIVAQAAAIVAYYPVALVSSKLGRRRTILLGVALLGLAFVSAAFFKSFTPWMFVFFSLAGIAWAAINVNSYPMVVELSKNSNVGKYTGYYYAFSMSAQVVTPILSGLFLEYVGYWTLFPYSTIFVALSFVTMLLVRHGDAKPSAQEIVRQDNEA